MKVLYLHELEDKRCAPLRFEVSTSYFWARRGGCLMRVGDEAAALLFYGLKWYNW